MAKYFLFAISVFVTVLFHCPKLHGFQEVAVAETQMQKYLLRSEDDLDEYYYLLKAKWESTPDSINFFSADCNVESYFSRAKKQRWIKVVRTSEVVDPDAPFTELATACTSERFVENGKFYLLSRGTWVTSDLIEFSNACSFISPLKLPFIGRNAIIKASSILDVSQSECFSASKSSLGLESTWSKNGFWIVHRFVFVDGVPVRCRSNYFGKEIVGNNVPDLKESTVVNQTDVKWKSFNKVQLPIALENISNTVNGNRKETIGIHVSVEWFLGKDIPESVRSDIQDISEDCKNAKDR